MPRETLTIPNTNVQVGTPAISPVTTTHATLEGVTITIDRTVANGLNARTAASTVNIETQLSFDSGATWTTYSSTLLIGGVLLDDQGVPLTISIDDCHFNPPINKGTRGRLVATAAGPSAVRIAGSIALNG